MVRMCEGTMSAKFYRVDCPNIDFKFLPKSKDNLFIPKRYCPSCRDSRCAQAASLPESVTEEIRRLIRPFQKGAKNEYPVDLDRRLMKAWDEKNYKDTVHEEISKYNAISPQEFAEIEAVIRLELGLSPGRLVVPRAETGPKSILRQILPKWSAQSGGMCTDMFVTSKVVQLIMDQNLKGVEIFPVLVKGKVSSGIFELVVSGDGGLPHVSDGGEWYHCEECLTHYLKADHPVTLSVDESQWDGSDLFHLARSGFVYASEKAFRVFNENFCLNEDCFVFTSISSDWIRPHFNKRGEPFHRDI